MIEQAFGILKEKFQILSRPIEILIEEKIRDLIMVCMILHNYIRIMQNDLGLHVPDMLPSLPVAIKRRYYDGNRKRQIVADYLSTL